MDTRIELTPTSPEVMHLSATDPVLGELIARVGDISQRLERDGFNSLASAIVSQQLSGAAATTIWKRVEAALGGVTPEAIMGAEDDTLRGAGLSRSKVSFLRDLAERTLDGRLDIAHLSSLSDDDIVAELISVKGIGRWTAEMYLIFSLGRPDVLALDDGAIRATIGWLYDLGGAAERSDAERIGEAWRPYRTTASLYLWRGLALRRAEEKAAR
ncbi:MAG: DNA-3-methyladenine glycosylase 2 family protein [Actinobacteria bacterium HGW-Actinobacteria-6]|nr:MAG: DNA-3-methyladenine glycosylase 2 family protein [Actinobacteria bacterium HGW-Actinobacteria-6]